MALEWSEEERCILEEGVSRFPLKSERCAALARVVYRVAAARDSVSTHGRQVRILGEALEDDTPYYIILKRPEKIFWRTHTLVETQAHAVDAATGVECCPMEQYLDTYWEYPETLHIIPVDVYQVDAGIEDQEP